MSDLGNKKVFSNNLKYYMQLNNKDRNEICKSLDIKYTTLTDWINGKKYPRIDKIEMLANYFGIQKSDLIEERTNYDDEIKKLETSNGVVIQIDKTRGLNANDIIEIQKLLLEELNNQNNDRSPQKNDHSN